MGLLTDARRHCPASRRRAGTRVETLDELATTTVSVLLDAAGAK
ncbi:hypothetical protein [Streptomyces variegatus]